MFVGGEDVAAFLGRARDAATIELASAHLPGVQAMVRAYTRGAGFDPTAGDPDPDLAAVIISACARSVANPDHTRYEQVGAYSVRPGTFTGWSLPELAILHTYRRRAA